MPPDNIETTATIHYPDLFEFLPAIDIGQLVARKREGPHPCVPSPFLFEDSLRMRRTVDNDLRCFRIAKSAGTVRILTKDDPGYRSAATVWCDACQKIIGAYAMFGE